MKATLHIQLHPSCLVAIAPVATVRTNDSGTPTPPQLVKAPGAGMASLPARRRRFRSLLPLLTLGAGLPAVAGPRVVMDFGPVAASNLNTVTVASPYVEDLLRLSNAQNPAFSMLSTTATYSTGRKSLFANTGNSTTTLTVDGGGTFTPVSVRCLTRNGNIGEIEFTGVLPNGGTTTVHRIGFGTNHQNGTVGTFPAAFDDIVALRILTASQYVSQFDDITVDLPELVVTTGGSTYTEGHGSIPVGLELAAPAPTAVSATWTIADVTTTAGSDYTLPGGIATGTLQIPAGQTRVQLAIPLLNDASVETLETFTVTFTGLTGGYFASGGNAVTVKIASEDGVANFAGWMTAHGLTAAAALPDADPNGDSIRNLEAWLHRINPAGPSPAAWLERRASYFTTASNVPGLRLTLPTPLPADVRVILEECTNPLSWSERTRRDGFGVGSLWTGPGASSVTESSTFSARTVSMPGSATIGARPRAFYRTKYELISGGGSSE